MSILIKTTVFTPEQNQTVTEKTQKEKPPIWQTPRTPAQPSTSTWTSTHLSASLPHTCGTEKKSVKLNRNSTSGSRPLYWTGYPKSKSLSQPENKFLVDLISNAIWAFVLGLLSLALGFWFGWNARGVEDQGAKYEAVETQVSLAYPQPVNGRFSF